jgi:hypothetical protein
LKDEIQNSRGRRQRFKKENANARAAAGKKPLGRPVHNPDYVLTPDQIAFIVAIVLVEVQELVLQWLLLLVVNQKFMKNGDTFVNSLKTIFDGKTAVPTQGDEPVAQKVRTRTATRASKAAPDGAEDGSTRVGS